MEFLGFLDLGDSESAKSCRCHSSLSGGSPARWIRSWSRSPNAFQGRWSPGGCAGVAATCFRCWAARLARLQVQFIGFNPRFVPQPSSPVPPRGRHHGCAWSHCNDGFFPDEPGQFSSRAAQASKYLHQGSAGCSCRKGKSGPAAIAHDTIEMQHHLCDIDVTFLQPFDLCLVESTVVAPARIVQNDFSSQE